MAYTEGLKRLLHKIGLKPTAYGSGANNGSSIDLLGSTGVGQHEFRVDVGIGANSGSSPTLTVKVQDSATNNGSDWADVSGATTSALDGTVNGLTTFYFRTANRYIRIVGTVGGTSTPTVTASVDVFAAAQNT